MQRQLSILFGLILSYYSPTILAETQPSELICIIAPEEGITHSNPKAKDPNLPSLWWAQEQYDPFQGKLIEGWVINPEINSIDLIVNRQLWTLLDYINRYRLVNQMGTVAREYQYNLRLVNQQNECLAFYTCDFSDSPYQCRIDFNSGEGDGLELEN